MQRISLLETAHQIVQTHLTSGEFAIDATLGNGHDAVFLAQTVGQAGHVFGFDIQNRALVATRERLLQQGLDNRTTLFHASHIEMLTLIPKSLHGHIQALMFNLGYLPGADKNLITQTESTLQALTAASQLLAVNGVITVIAYPGHTGGDQETASLTTWCDALAQQPDFQVEIILSKHDQATAPRLFVIRKQTYLL